MFTQQHSSFFFSSSSSSSPFTLFSLFPSSSFFHTFNFHYFLSLLASKCRASLFLDLSHSSPHITNSIPIFNFFPSQLPHTLPVSSYSSPFLFSKATSDEPIKPSGLVQNLCLNWLLERLQQTGTGEEYNYIGLCSSQEWAELEKESGRYLTYFDYFKKVYHFWSMKYLINMIDYCMLTLFSHYKSIHAFFF